MCSEPPCETLMSCFMNHLNREQFKWLITQHFTVNGSEQTLRWRHKERDEVYALLFEQLCGRKVVV